MLTSKQRKILRGMSNDMSAIFQIGKSGVGETMIAQLDDALRARQMIKITVLQNADADIRETAEELAQALGAHVVDCLGRKIILYRPDDKEPLLKL